MLKFTEYVQVMDAQLEESFWKDVKGGLSGIGTAGYQAARGLGNMTKGAAKTLTGIAGLPANYKNYKTVGSGIKDIGKGLIQTVASPISGIVRANQVSNGNVGNKLIAPKTSGTASNFFGVADRKSNDNQEPAKSEVPVDNRKAEVQLLVKDLIDAMRNKNSDRARQITHMLKIKYNMGIVKNKAGKYVVKSLNSQSAPSNNNDWYDRYKQLRNLKDRNPSNFPQKYEAELQTLEKKLQSA